MTTATGLSPGVVERSRSRELAETALDPLRELAVRDDRLVGDERDALRLVARGVEDGQRHARASRVTGRRSKSGSSASPKPGSVQGKTRPES